MTDFIIIGNKNALLWKDIFPLYMEGKVKFGYNQLRFFITEDGTLNDYEGTGRWFTNLEVKKNNPPLKLVPFDENFHKKFDTLDAVNTDKINSIPDVDCLLGVPTGIIDYLNPDQFEILGKIKTGKDLYDFGKPIVEGKIKYIRILIRRKV